MKLRYLALTILCASAFAQSNDLGLAFENVPDSPQKRVELAKQLGAGWYRPAPVLLGDVNPTCADCEAATASGLKLALVIRNSASAAEASAAVGDPAMFERKLRSVLERYKPALLIVESEPDNQRDSFAGSPEEYGAEVKLACQLASAAQMKCADGGMSSAAIAALATDQRWSTDKIDAAKFANAIEATRASGHDGIGIFGKQATSGKADLDAVVNAAEKYLAKNRAQIIRARALIKATEASGTTYFNFHWSELQPDVLPKLADILHEITKRPLMSSAVGQRSERAFETGEKIRVLREQRVGPIIWVASDGKGGVVGLVDSKGKPRPLADTFRRESAKSK